MEPKIRSLAREAYARYAAVTDWKNYQGLPMPQFDDLPDKIKEAWDAAVLPLLDYANLQTIANEAMFVLKDTPDNTHQNMAFTICESLGLDWGQVKHR